MSFRNMLFWEFVKTLEISVKSIFLEPEKFENIQKLSSTVKKPLQTLGITSAFYSEGTV